MKGSGGISCGPRWGHLHVRPYPQYGWDFPEETLEKFRKDPGNALKAFPGVPLESAALGAPKRPIIQGI